MTNNSQILDMNTSLLPIQGRWKFLWISIVLSFLGTMYTIYLEMQKSEIFQRVLNDGDLGAIKELELFERAHMAEYLLIAAIGIVTVVAVCMWFYRASDNLHRSGLMMMEYSPGWAVGWFFIPIVHIVFPFLVAREISKGSEAMGDTEHRSTWKTIKPDTLVTVWGWLWIIRMGFSYIFAIYMAMTAVRMDPTDPTVEFILQDKYKYITMASYLVSIIDGIVLILWTKKVTMKQEAHLANTH